jgi:hypothetical protein
MFSLLNKLNVFFYLSVSLVIIDSNFLCSSTVAESSEPTFNRTDEVDDRSLSSSQHQECTTTSSLDFGFGDLFAESADLLGEINANDSSSEKNETTEDHSDEQKLNEDSKEENEVKQDQYLEDLITEINRN